MAYDYNEREYKAPKLKTDRQMWKLMLFGILTLGIYNIVFFMPFSYDLDKIAPKRDRSRTMSYIFAFILGFFTVNIVIYIWHYQIAERIEEALVRRNIPYKFETKNFWLEYFLGSFILIGPFIYFHKLCRAMNLLCESYNENPVIDNSIR